MPSISSQGQADLNNSPDSALEPDPFAHLHKMSTTAGLGSGDYVAINSFALAALLFGIGSALVLWGSLLLLIVPGIAIVCSIVAFVQISHSNGTQTGRGLATLGLLLAIGIGGGFTGQVIAESIRNAKEQDQVIALMREFGAHLRDQKYSDAYELFDDRFRARVPESAFIDQWKIASGSSFRGGITGADWNGLLKFDDDPVTGQRLASGIMLIGFEKIHAQERQPVVFVKSDDRWRMRSLPDMFADQPAPQPSRGSRPAGPIGPMGPPKPTP